MENSYHYLLMANHLVLQKMLFENVKELGMTLGQPKVLDFLKDHDGAAQKDIAIGCYIEPATLTSVLNGMEKAQMITRQMQNGNRRTLYVFLTEKGKKLQQRIDDEFLKLEEYAFSGFTEKEKNNTINYLKQIYRNLMIYKERSINE